MGSKGHRQTKPNHAAEVPRYRLIHAPLSRKARSACLVYADDSKFYRELSPAHSAHDGEASYPMFGNGLVEGDLDAYLREVRPEFTVESPTHLPGEYHPRIWRDHWPPHPCILPYHDAWRSAGASYARLSEMLLAIFHVVEPDERNMKAFGHECRHLLLLACTEVENAWKGVLVANGYASEMDRLDRRDYIKLRKPMRLHEWIVRLGMYPQLGMLAPFKDWRENDSESLPWYDAYNATKHGRETRLAEASLQNVVDAMAALAIMINAQFGAQTPDKFGVPPASRFQVIATPRWRPREVYFPASADKLPIEVPHPDLARHQRR